MVELGNNVILLRTLYIIEKGMNVKEKSVTIIYRTDYIYTSCVCASGSKDTQEMGTSNTGSRKPNKIKYEYIDVDVAKSSSTRRAFEEDFFIQRMCYTLRQQLKSVSVYKKVMLLSSYKQGL